ncbi:DUF1189 domain-containing protein [Clostridium sp. C2-6-12]|uniref:DUF1189 domain-containing protein n=1 Tax=Clostridium sp. C2-6-12 TaxID=2698832 RepID=UPI00136BA530|nr:DUF1189 domain-containing protein [Clostridium sp. C2-6-12]
MNTKMGFRHKFAYSFFNFPAYKEFLAQGFGKALLYIFLVTLIFSTITNVNRINQFLSETTDMQTEFNKYAPQFELKNGLLTVDSAEPIYYRKDGFTLIVDTTGKTNKSISDTYADVVYIDSNEFIIKQRYKTVQVMKFSDIPEMNVTNKTIQNIMSLLKIIFPVMLLFFDPIISFISNLASGCIILAPLSLTISSFMNVKLNYRKTCILSFYAMTMPLLLETLLAISGIVLNEFSVLFYLISLIYCGLAIRELKNKDKSNLNILN